MCNKMICIKSTIISYMLTMLIILRQATRGTYFTPLPYQFFQIWQDSKHFATYIKFQTVSLQTVVNNFSDFSFITLTPQTAATIAWNDVANKRNFEVGETRPAELMWCEYFPTQLLCGFQLKRIWNSRRGWSSPKQTVHVEHCSYRPLNLNVFDFLPKLKHHQSNRNQI